MMSETIRAPTSAEELRDEILRRHDGLSKRLQQIARFVLDDPNALALETLAVIAERTGVQPSAIVRFAQAFGFDGATQMQRLFRDGLLSGHAALGYNERVRQFSATPDSPQAGAPAGLLSEFIKGNGYALQNLAQTVSDQELSAAVAMIVAADAVFVVGFRRSFPIAAYLAYSLQQAGKRTVFIDGVGGMAGQQVQTMTQRDLMIAISYHPYAEETVSAIDAASARGAKLLALTDSLVSPIAKTATATLQIREAEIRAFRSLSVSFCLAQALVIGFAFQNSPAGRPPQRRGKARNAEDDTETHVALSKLLE